MNIVIKTARANPNVLRRWFAMRSTVHTVPA